MDIEKLRKRYASPMMNQDIMECIEEIEKLNKLLSVEQISNQGKQEEIERLGKALIQYKNIVDNYCIHSFGCDIDKTDFCTCGLKEAKNKVREALKEVLGLEIDEV